METRESSYVFVLLRECRLGEEVLLRGEVSLYLVDRGE